MTINSIPLNQLPGGDDARRDRWGRYLVVPLIGDKPIPYTRATTIAKALDSGGGLAPWKATMAACGLIMRRGLRARWESMLAQYGDPWYAGESIKRLCRELVEECAAVGGSNDRKEIGSALHQITALVDVGRQPQHLTEETERDIKAYLNGRNTAGIQIVEGMVEVQVVLDNYQVAGTFDRLVTVPNFDLPLISDLKTGANLEYSWQSIAVQEAIYSRANAIYKQGAAPDGSQDIRIPMPAVNQDHGLIFWLNAGTGELEIYLVDLNMGWEAFEHSMWVRNWRNTKPAIKLTAYDLVPALQASIEQAEKRDEGETTDGTGQVHGNSPAPISTPADAGHSPSSPPFDYDKGGILPTGMTIGEMQSTGVIRPAPGVPGEDSQLSSATLEEIREWLQSRINDIGRHEKARAYLGQNWPTNIPTLRASNEHTPEQLGAIEGFLDAVERRWELKFPDPKPGTPLAKVVNMFPGSTIQPMPTDKGNQPA